MKKKSKNKSNKKTDKFIAFVTIALVVLLIVWVIKDNIMIKKNSEIVSPYADFNEITVKSAIDKIDQTGLTLVYVGYDGCSACEDFVVKLASLAKDYDVVVYYVDYKSADKESDEWKTFTSKLDLSTSITIEKDGEEKTETKAIGEFLEEKGYTPVLAIFDSGRMVNGSIGNIDEDSLETKLESAGYVKNS